MTLLQDIRISRQTAPAFVIVGLYWGAFAAFAPQLKDAADLGDAEFGIALLTGAIGAVAAMWLAPRLDALLKHHSLMVGIFMLAAAFLLPAVATSAVTFSLAMVLASGASGLLDVIMNTRVSHLEAQHNRPLMNLNHAIFSFAYALSALTAGGLREMQITPLVAFALIGVASVVCAAQVRNDQAFRETSSLSEASSPLPKALIIVGGVIVLFGFMAEQSTEAWSALHLERRFSVGAAEGALGPAILGITMGFGRLSGQLIVRKFAEGVVLRWAGALAALGTIIAAWAPNSLLAYLGFGILGFGVSVVAPMAFAWVGKHVSPALRGLAISRLAVVGYAGFFIGPPVMGFLAESFGLPIAFSVIAVSLLTISVVLVPMLRVLAGRSPHPAPSPHT